MKKKITALITAIAAASAAVLPATAILSSAETTDASAQARQMEYLDRGLVAVKTTTGVYLSWRLLGTESLSNQAFDIYRDGTKIDTTGAHDATCYTDASGSANSNYIVVPAGESIDGETAVTPSSIYKTGTNNSFTYTDIPIVKPAGGTAIQVATSTNKLTDDTTVNYTYSANDASVGDLDGDGQYELVLKWDPSNSEDSGTWNGNYTGNVYLDGYEINSENTGYKWRIDLGVNIRAGAHYTQFMVYDLDGDGKAEIACKTAPGSKDGEGKYVTEAGDTDTIRNADNNIDYRQSEYGGSLGRIYQGPEYLTVFDGDTGKALYTTDYIPRGNVSDWGDSGANRSERYLAAVAYLDGERPSLVMCRGYYAKAVLRAYDWDGSVLTQKWECSGTAEGKNSIYGQGNHNLSVADIDNDGKDEIVYGSASIDDDGAVIGNTQLGHGDALHVSDFNNDGVQEAFSVKEEASAYATNGGDFRIAGTGDNIFALAGATDDVGRGVMDNIDDEYASAHTNALALGWTSAHAGVYDLGGNQVSTSKPASSGSTNSINSLIYWDGDLGRETLDGTVISKFHVETGSSDRFFDGNTGYFTGVHTNNDTKKNISLTADLWGDWREEIIAPLENDSALRIFTSTIPTTYRLTTLMHDSQYRSAIAWQNVGYNQPPHTSYYIGSAALAKEGNSTLNYLAPAVAFTTVTYPAGAQKTPAPVETTAPTDSPESSANPTDSPESSATPTDSPESSATPTDSPESSANPTDSPESSANPTDSPESSATPTDSPEVTDAPAYSPVIYDAYTKSAMFNSAQTADSAAVIFACYGDGGILKSAAIKNAAVSAEEINTIQAPDGFNDDGDVKVYVWESVESMKPLDVNGTGITVPTPAPEPVKIMPLGDSITNGFSVPGAYRNELCSLIESDGLSDMVDFVGSQKTGTGYDNDNEGHSGWAIAAISAADACEGKSRSGLTTNIDSWLNTYSPDIVLLQIGTNDILSLYKLEEAPARLETLVDKILAKLPSDGKLYLATIPYIQEGAEYDKTGKTQTQLDGIVDTYNASVKALAESKGLTLVDINSCVTLSDLNDGIHPTADGYAKMGRLWYSVLESEIRSRVE